MAHLLLPILLASSILKGVICVTVTVNHRELIVKEGDPIEMLCQVKTPVQFCRLEVPSEGSFMMLENRKGPISYFGSGFSNGDCGVRIDSASEKYNGEFLCAVTPVGETRESRGRMNLTIAKTPMRPELRVLPPKLGDSYQEGEILSASCSVRNGRPAANISWYIGDEKIYDRHSQAYVFVELKDLYTIEQNLTRKIQSSDNGKPLKCVAEHPLLGDRQNTSMKIIYVQFAPKEENQPLEKFGLVEGEEGRISVTVQANPQPAFTWLVGGETLHEGDTKDRFYSAPGVATPNMGPGSWDSVLVINPLKKEDVEKTYQLVALNKLGKRTYTIVISTSPEPRVMELGAGAIVGIVVAILLILTVAALLLFARAKGRWCFAGAMTKGEKNAQNPEKQQPDGNDNPAANHNAQFISDSPDLKKPKEDTQV